MGREAAKVTAKRRALRIVNRETGEVVSAVDVTGKSERQIYRVEMGMLINMDTDRFYIDDSATDEDVSE